MFTTFIFTHNCQRRVCGSGSLKLKLYWQIMINLGFTTCRYSVLRFWPKVDICWLISYTLITYLEPFIILLFIVKIQSFLLSCSSLKCCNLAAFTIFLRSEIICIAGSFIWMIIVIDLESIEYWNWQHGLFLVSKV